MHVSNAKHPALLSPKAAAVVSAASVPSALGPKSGESEGPSDLDAERLVAGAVLLQPALLEDLVATLRPEDFAYTQYAQVYAACIDLMVNQQPITTATVARQLGANLTDIVALMECAEPALAPFMASRVISLRKRRALLNCSRLARTLALSEDADPDAALAQVGEALTREQGRGPDLVELRAGVDDVLGRLSRYVTEPDAVTGIRTGWRKFDRVLDGLQRQAVTVIYARTGSYKSMFVQNLAWMLARQGVPGAMFITEMGTAAVTERLLQLETGLNFRQLRWTGQLGNHLDTIRSAAEDLATYPLWLNDRSVLDVAFVRGFLARLKRTHDIQWAVIDLINHVHSNRFGPDNETKNESFVAQQVKQIAKDLDIHVLFTAHVAKADRRSGAPTRPYLETEEIKGASSFSQDADAAISLVVVEQEDGAWQSIGRQRRMEIEAAGGPLYLLAAVTKNRSGIMSDIAFRVDLAAGGRMEPELPPA